MSESVFVVERITAAEAKRAEPIDLKYVDGELVSVETAPDVPGRCEGEYGSGCDSTDAELMPNPLLQALGDIEEAEADMMFLCCACADTMARDS